MPQGAGMASTDQRAHPRVPLILPAMLRLASADQFPCMVTDISGGGAGLQFSDCAPGAECVAQLAIEEFGSFDGITVRDSGDKRGLRFVQGEAERNHLLVKLTLYVEEGLIDASRDGCWPAEATLTLTRTTGIHEKCGVLRISLHGVSLATEQRPPVGELVRLGRMYGRVTQHLASGIDICFLSFVNPSPDGPVVAIEQAQVPAG
jgi:hypothetical protein